MLMFLSKVFSQMIFIWRLTFFKKQIYFEIGHRQTNPNLKMNFETPIL